MPTRERAGYTSNLFVIDVSASMGEPMLLDGVKKEDDEGHQLTKLEWAKDYVMRKIQELIFTERKTDECGIILFGTDETDNKVNDENEGYENILELVPLSAPTSRIIDALRAVKPQAGPPEPLDAVIVAVQTQSIHLGNKRTWKRRITLVTDGEGECNFDDWEEIVGKMSEWEVKFSVIGINFDDEDEGFRETRKSKVKRENEKFWHDFTSRLPDGLGMVGNVTLAIEALSVPQLKQSQSALISTWLRIGNRDMSEEADGGFLEIPVKMAKATSVAKPTPMKKLHKRGGRGEWRPVALQTDYVVVEEEEEEPATTNGTQTALGGDGEVKEEEEEKAKPEVTVAKEDLVKAYKYGATWVPCEEGEFEKLQTQKGIEVVGFIRESEWRRELALGEVSYIYPSDNSAKAQIQFSAIVQAMAEKGAMMIVRYVWRDGADPKVGVCKAQPIGEVEWGGVDCLLYVQMPFAEDVRQYKFNSLTRLVNRNGEPIKKHSRLPTKEQQAAMDEYVDAMDLMDADEDEEGNPAPWFDPALSYNPALHRIKQALFHGARVLDPDKDPLPPPHPELVKYFDPPEKVVERAKPAVDRLKRVMNIKKVPAKAAGRGQKKGAADDAPEYLYESVEDILGSTARSAYTVDPNAAPRTPTKGKGPAVENSHSGNGDGPAGQYLPSPAPSVAPEPGRLISTADPIKDFDALLEHGDMVSKAMEDMGFVIRRMAGDPKRNTDIIKCMKRMREVGAEEDEADTYQEFLTNLKKEAQSPDFPNPDLWPLIQKQGPKISWITSDEAPDLGGVVSSNVSYDFLMK